MQDSILEFRGQNQQSKMKFKKNPLIYTNQAMWQKIRTYPLVSPFQEMGIFINNNLKQKQ